MSLENITPKIELDEKKLHIESSVFLLYFFLYVYGLELGLQLLVLVYSFFCYDELGEPKWLVLIDGMIAILLLIEVRSHYMSRPENFWLDGEMCFDALVCMFSVLFIVLYFLAGMLEMSEDMSTMVHLIREATRVFRLPTFTRNFNKMIKKMN